MGFSFFLCYLNLAALPGFDFTILYATAVIIIIFFENLHSCYYIYYYYIYVLIG